MSERKKRLRRSFSKEESQELLDLYEKARAGGDKPEGWIPSNSVLKDWVLEIARGKPTSKHRYKVYYNFLEKHLSGKPVFQDPSSSISMFRLADESDSDDVYTSDSESELGALISSPTSNAKRKLESSSFSNLSHSDDDEKLEPGKKKRTIDRTIDTPKPSAGLVGCLFNEAEKSFLKNQLRAEPNYLKTDPPMSWFKQVARNAGNETRHQTYRNKFKSVRDELIKEMATESTDTTPRISTPKISATIPFSQPLITTPPTKQERISSTKSKTLATPSKTPDRNPPKEKSSESNGKHSVTPTNYSSTPQKPFGELFSPKLERSSTPSTPEVVLSTKEMDMDIILEIVFGNQIQEDTVKYRDLLDITEFEKYIQRSLSIENMSLYSITYHSILTNQERDLGKVFVTFVQKPFWIKHFAENKPLKIFVRENRID